MHCGASIGPRSTLLSQTSGKNAIVLYSHTTLEVLGQAGDAVGVGYMKEEKKRDRDERVQENMD